MGIYYAFPVNAISEGIIDINGERIDFLSFEHISK